MDIVPLDASRADLWCALFEACASACYCRYWHFEGNKNDWLARCVGDATANRDEQLALVRDAEPAGRGLLAVEGEDTELTAVGWMKLTPRSSVPKLLRQGAYRRLDLGAAEGVWSIGCFLVRPEQRRRGVARALVRASVDWVATWGGHAVEAYPRGATTELADEQAFMGTADLFASCGFERIAGDPAYPVFRRTTRAR